MTLCEHNYYAITIGSTEPADYSITVAGPKLHSATVSDSDMRHIILI